MVRDLLLLVEGRDKSFPSESTGMKSSWAQGPDLMQSTSAETSLCLTKELLDAIQVENGMLRKPTLATPVQSSMGPHRGKGSHITAQGPNPEYSQESLLLGKQQELGQGIYFGISVQGLIKTGDKEGAQGKRHRSISDFTMSPRQYSSSQEEFEACVVTVGS